ncbi:MAG: hypothetical protein KDA24_17835 [Deltaproteobacteria bacterium]|nr:hypothetical protein [Deltaproteobacteria bacterium]
MIVTQRQLITHYERNETDAGRLLQSWRELEDEVEALHAEASIQHAAGLQALAQAYLADLTPEALARAEKLTGYRGFTRRDPLRAMGQEEHVLRHTIARIEADERFVRRQLLVGPGGELTLAVEEAQSMLDPWETECAPYEAAEGWDELLQTGYDTPTYAVSFFEKRYWTLWRLGDLVCEALGVDDFGDDVLPAFQAADRQRQTWRRQLAVAEEEVGAVHELVRTRDHAEARIPRLPQLYLVACQGQLAQYFADADLSLLAQWLIEDAAPDSPDRAVQGALRRVSGVGAKVRMLAELQRQGIAGSIRDLQTRKAKFSRKAEKYARGKYAGVRFPNTAQDNSFRSKLGKYRERPAKLSRLARRIAAYEAYDRFDLAQNADELWFLEMTGKRPPSQLPNTRRWYDRHPDLVPRVDESVMEPEELLQAVAAAEAADSLGYLS